MLGAAERHAQQLGPPSEHCTPKDRYAAPAGCRLIPPAHRQRRRVASAAARLPTMPISVSATLLTSLRRGFRVLFALRLLALEGFADLGICISEPIASSSRKLGSR